MARRSRQAPTVATAAESIVAAFKVGFIRIGDLLKFQTGRPPNP
jgi:hypothetical protein